MPKAVITFINNSEDQFALAVEADLIPSLTDAQLLNLANGLRKNSILGNGDYENNGRVMSIQITGLDRMVPIP